MASLRLANRTREISLFTEMLEDQANSLPNILFLEAQKLREIMAAQTFFGDM